MVHRVAGRGLHRADGRRRPARRPPSGPAPVPGPVATAGRGHCALRAAHRGRWRGIPGPVRTPGAGRRAAAPDPHRRGDRGRPRVFQRGRRPAHRGHVLGGPRSPGHRGGPGVGGFARPGLPVGHVAPAVAGSGRRVLDRVPVLLHLVRRGAGAGRADPGHVGDRGVAPRRVPGRPGFGDRSGHRADGRRGGHGGRDQPAAAAAGRGPAGGPAGRGAPGVWWPAGRQPRPAGHGAGPPDCRAGRTVAGP